MDAKTWTEQFVAQIEGLTKHKEFCGKAQPARFLIPLINNEKWICDKKRSYDFAFKKICDAYGMNTENLSEELDLIWQNVRRKSRNKILDFYSHRLSFENGVYVFFVFTKYMEKSKEIAYKRKDEYLKKAKEQGEG